MRAALLLPLLLLPPLLLIGCPPPPNRPGRAGADGDPRQAMKRSNCATCHALEAQRIGPSYREIAARYEPTEENVSILVGKVKNGGSGVWGRQPMPPHPRLSPDEIDPMVRWILAREPAPDAANP